MKVSKLYSLLTVAVLLLAAVALYGYGYESMPGAEAAGKSGAPQQESAAKKTPQNAVPQAEATKIVPNKRPLREDEPGDAYRVATDRISVARADFMACEADDLTPLRPSNLDLEAFARHLNGTWVRQLTWVGVPIETESAIYYDIRGNNGFAMMIDRANMGSGPLSARAAELTKSMGKRLRTPTLTFVDCDYKIRDQYFKISDDYIFDGMPLSKAVPASPKNRLQTVWKDLLAQGYLDKAQAELKNVTISLKPDGDLFLPATVGALWQVSLSPESHGRFWGARLFMNGQYHGTLAGLAGRGTLPGTETGHFFMEGSRFVSARLPKEFGKLKGKLGEEEIGFATDCSSFLGLDEEVNWERVVLDPGGF